MPTLRISIRATALAILLGVVAGGVQASESVPGAFDECLVIVKGKRRPHPNCLSPHSMGSVHSSSLLQSLQSTPSAAALVPHANDSTHVTATFASMVVENLAPLRVAVEKATNLATDASSRPLGKTVTALVAVDQREDQVSPKELVGKPDHVIDMISFAQRCLGQVRASSKMSVPAVVTIVLLMVVFALVVIVAIIFTRFSPDSPRYSAGVRKDYAKTEPSSPISTSAGYVSRHWRQPPDAHAATLSAGRRDGTQDSRAHMSLTARMAPDPMAVPESSHGMYTFGATLCPDLVVPNGSECTVVVPKVPLDAMHDMTFTVDDSMGSPAFRVAWFPEPHGLDLVSVGGDVVFAHCRAEDRGVGIYHGPADTLQDRFAEVYPDPASPDGQGYEATTRAGYKVLFSADGNLGNMNATDKDGRLLSIYETVQAQKRNVRVGPLVDVGFVVLSLLGIDLLQGQQRHPRPTLVSMMNLDARRSNVMGSSQPSRW